MTSVMPKAPPEPVVPLTQAEKAEVDRLLSVAKSQLVLRQPFFASLVLRRPLIITERITPTAAADAKGRIYVNPRFVLSKPVGEVSKLVFLLAHETMHIAFMHCHKATVGERNMRACNIAMDKVINELLIAENCGEFIEGGQRHAGAENMKWQDLYIEPPPGGGGGDPGGIGDDLVACPDGEPGDAESQEIEEQMKQEIAQAAQAAKMQGKLPASMQRIVDDLLNVRVPYHQIMERFMVAFTQTDYSWKRPNRRFVGKGIYLPSLDRVPRMGPLVIGIDTSGSITDKVLQHFASHTNRIIETCLPELVYVVYCDAKVAHVDVFEPGDYPIQFKAHGGGGTDMREVWRWADENAETHDCLVLFTDGYTPWPEEVSVPSLVVCTTDEVAPEAIAETVHFDPED